MALFVNRDTTACTFQHPPQPGPISCPQESPHGRGALASRTRVPPFTSQGSQYSTAPGPPSDWRFTTSPVPLTAAPSRSRRPGRQEFMDFDPEIPRGAFGPAPTSDQRFTTTPIPRTAAPSHSRRPGCLEFMDFDHDISHGAFSPGPAQNERLGLEYAAAFPLGTESLRGSSCPSEGVGSVDMFDPAKVRGWQDEWENRQPDHPLLSSRDVYHRHETQQQQPHQHQFHHLQQQQQHEFGDGSTGSDCGSGSGYASQVRSSFTSLWPGGEGEECGFLVMQACWPGYASLMDRWLCKPDGQVVQVMSVDFLQLVVQIATCLRRTVCQRCDDWKQVDLNDKKNAISRQETATMITHQANPDLARPLANN